MPPKRKISINYDFGPGKYRFGKKRGKHISDEQWQMTGLGKKSCAAEGRIYRRGGVYKKGPRAGTRFHRTCVAPRGLGVKRTRHPRVLSMLPRNVARRELRLRRERGD